MTEKQKAFCEEYVKCYNAAKAYRIAYGGDDNRNTHRVMKNPEVQAYIKELQIQAMREYGDVANLLAKQLMDDVLFRDEDGKHSATWTKSADLLGKQFGLQNQKVDISSTTGITINIGEDDG